MGHAAPCNMIGSIQRRRNLHLGMGACAMLLLFMFYHQLQSWRSKTALVTGGLGFIGSHLVEELLAQGYKVLIYDNESNGHNHNIAANFLKGDVTMVQELSDIQEGQADYVVHLAAAISVAESMKLPMKYMRNNVEGSKLVLQMAREKWHSKMVVAASSAAIYGDKAPLPISETSGYGGKSPYADSKYKMEEEMQRVNQKHGLKTIALRFFNVYGPRQDPKSDYSGVMSKFMEFASKPPYNIRIFGDGKQTRDFIYVKDIARAIRTALESDLPQFDAFNVCTGHETTIQELATTVKQEFTPHAHGTKITLTNLEGRAGDIRESVCEPSKAANKLGFKSKYTVAEGLAHTKDWYMSTL